MRIRYTESLKCIICSIIADNEQGKRDDKPSSALEEDSFWILKLIKSDR